jgi:hypothetical protein
MTASSSPPNTSKKSTEETKIYNSEEQDDEIPSLLPLRVAPEYRKFGWILFAFLVLLFLSGASTLISLKFEGRKAPEIKYTIRKSNDLKFPNSILICPQKLSGKVTWHYVEQLDSPNSQLDGSFDFSLVSISYSNWLDMDCLQIQLNASVLRIPSAVQFSLVWSQSLKSYSDAMLVLDNEHSNSAWLSTGLYNSSKGATNDIDISLEKYSYLTTSPPGLSQQWKLVTATTAYYFYEISSNAKEIVCGNTSHLKYTKGCSTRMRTCRGDLDNLRDQTCTMMTIVFISFKSDFVNNFEEMDPVDWLEIISSLGGYWVYIGAGFSLFFAVKRGTTELGLAYWVSKILGFFFQRKKKRSSAEKVNVESELIAYSFNDLKTSLIDSSARNFEKTQSN